MRVVSMLPGAAKPPRFMELTLSAARTPVHARKTPMSPLDHLPIPFVDLTAGCALFEAVGFVVAPTCVYTSPEYPEARWENRSVFLREGWFDLQHTPTAPAALAGAPSGCLFRTRDLSAVRTALTGMCLTEPYRLLREWPGRPELGTESFALFSVRERISPLVLAAIEHDYPCPDTLEAWFEHPNTATRIAGLTFSGSPGPYAEAAARVLDISGFRYLPEEDYAAAFGAAKAVVRVEVASIEAAHRRITGAGIAATRTSGGLRVPPAQPLAFGFEFFQA